MTVVATTRVEGARAVTGAVAVAAGLVLWAAGVGDCNCAKVASINALWLATLPAAGLPGVVETVDIAVAGEGAAAVVPTPEGVLVILSLDWPFGTDFWVDRQAHAPGGWRFVGLLYASAHWPTLSAALG